MSEELTYEQSLEHDHNIWGMRILGFISNYVIYRLIRIIGLIYISMFSRITTSKQSTARNKMRPSNVYPETMTTVEECDAAIYHIENNHKNYGVSLRDWMSGAVNCYISKAATKKIEQLEKRANKLAAEAA